jgi:hypothetical protein
LSVRGCALPFFAADSQGNLGISDELDQCNYVFGDGVAQAGLANNVRFQQTFGGDTPGSGLLNASRIVFMDYRQVAVFVGVCVLLVVAYRSTNEGCCGGS